METESTTNRRNIRREKNTQQMTDETLGEQQKTKQTASDGQTEPKYTNFLLDSIPFFMKTTLKMKNFLLLIN